MNIFLSDSPNTMKFGFGRKQRSRDLLGENFNQSPYFPAKFARRHLAQGNSMLRLQQRYVSNEERYNLKTEIYRKRLIEAILDSGQESAGASKGLVGALPKLLTGAFTLAAGAIAASVAGAVRSAVVRAANALKSPRVRPSGTSRVPPPSDSTRVRPSGTSRVPPHSLRPNVNDSVRIRPNGSILPSTPGQVSETLDGVVVRTAPSTLSPMSIDETIRPNTTPAVRPPLRRSGTSRVPPLSSVAGSGARALGRTIAKGALGAIVPGGVIGMASQAIIMPTTMGDGTVTGRITAVIDAVVNRMVQSNGNIGEIDKGVAVIRQVLQEELGTIEDKMGHKFKVTALKKEIAIRSLIYRDFWRNQMKNLLLMGSISNSTLSKQQELSSWLISGQGIQAFQKSSTGMVIAPDGSIVTRRQREAIFASQGLGPNTTNSSVVTNTRPVAQLEVSPKGGLIIEDDRIVESLDEIAKDLKNYLGSTSSTTIVTNNTSSGGHPYATSPTATVRNLSSSVSNSGMSGRIQSSRAVRNSSVDSSYYSRVGYIESKFDPNAVSSTGATGIFQLTRGTAKDYNVRNRRNVEQSIEGMVRLTESNKRSLIAAGFEPTQENLYMAHQQGPNGAIRLLRAARGDSGVNLSANSLSVNMTSDMRRRIAPRGVSRALSSRGSQRVASDFVSAWGEKYRKDSRAVSTSNYMGGRGEGNEGRSSSSVRSSSVPTSNSSQSVSGFRKAHQNVNLSNMDSGTVSAMSRLRSNFGSDLTVTSAYRSPSYNRSVGGAVNSMHMKGKAIDVVTRNMGPDQKAHLLSSALDSGFSSVGFYPNFMHFDTRSGAKTWGTQPAWAEGPMSSKFGRGRSNGSTDTMLAQNSSGSNTSSNMSVSSESGASTTSSGLDLNGVSRGLSIGSSIMSSRSGESSGALRSPTQSTSFPRVTPTLDPAVSQINARLLETLTRLDSSNVAIQQGRNLAQNANLNTDSILSIVDDIGLHNLLQEGL